DQPIGDIIQTRLAEISNFPKGRLWRFLAAAAWIARCAGADSALLELGKPVDRRIAGGESHEYRFTLSAGDFAELWLEQLSLNVAVTVIAPDGSKPHDGDYAVQGDTEMIEMIGRAAGDYVLRVTVPDGGAKPGDYQLTLRQIARAEPKHDSRIAA